MSHCKKLTKKNKEQLSSRMDESKENGLKALSKEKRKTLEAYQHLFYHLQVGSTCWPRTNTPRAEEKLSRATAHFARSAAPEKVLQASRLGPLLSNTRQPLLQEERATPCYLGSTFFSKHVSTAMKKKGIKKCIGCVKLNKNSQSNIVSQRQS